MKRIHQGIDAARSLLAERGTEIDALYVAGRIPNELIADAKRRGVRIQQRDPSELARLGGAGHGGVVTIAGPYPYASLDDVLHHQPRLLVALDQITDPHNLGAIVRSAVAFGADGILTLKDRAASINAVVVRAAAGATERARIVKVTNLARTLTDLGKQGFQVVGLDAAGPIAIDALPEAPLGRVLVVGAEGHGLRRLVRDKCSLLAHIPMHDGTESLNASVATSIALFALRGDERA